MSGETHGATGIGGAGDDLPPVQPPSAGFILQLFVVPALIVLAVVAVWALFGRLAAGEQDWRQLVQELESPNPHIYRRAMFGLAQVLDTDQRRGEQGQQLATNPEIAEALAKGLKKHLDGKLSDEETLKSQVYLVRAVGLLQVPETTVPVLITALDPAYDVEVRKGAITSLALIAGRALERGTPLAGPVVPALITLSGESEPSLRRAATFALGLVPGPDSEQRLLVLLQDGADEMTAVNAAIALARRESTAGYPVFVETLAPAAAEATLEQRQDRLLILRNSLKAIGGMASKFTPDERAELIRLTQQLTEDDAELRIRVDAQGALSALTAVK